MTLQQALTSIRERVEKATPYVELERYPFGSRFSWQLHATTYTAAHFLSKEDAEFCKNAAPQMSRLLDALEVLVEGLEDIRGGWIAGVNVGNGVEVPTYVTASSLELDGAVNSLLTRATAILSGEVENV